MTIAAMATPTSPSKAQVHGPGVHERAISDRSAVR
jgi:hypothetical protein